LALLQTPQSGSSADGGGVPCQIVAFTNMKLQLEGGLQHPDCNQTKTILCQLSDVHLKKRGGDKIRQIK
jgi:hypothetical protein